MSMHVQAGSPESSGLLVAGYEDGSLAGWDLRSRSVLWRSKLFDEPAVAVAAALTKKGSCRVVGAGATDKLHVGKLPSTVPLDDGGVAQLRDLKSLQLKHAGINSVSVRGDARLFATGGWDNRVRLFTWPKASPLAILEYHRAAINVVVWSRAFFEVDGGSLLAAGSKDTRISLWSVYQANDTT